jgi:hypothetical protein
VGFDSEGQPLKADEVVRMGRVVTNKETAGFDIEEEAKCRC